MKFLASLYRRVKVYFQMRYEAGVSPREVEEWYSRIVQMDFDEFVELASEEKRYGRLKACGESLQYYPHGMRPFNINEAADGGIVVTAPFDEEGGCPPLEFYRSGVHLKDSEWIKSLEDLHNWFVRHDAYKTRQAELPFVDYRK